MPFPLFTSFKRPADDRTQSCMSSWKKAGFDIVTVDGPGGSKPRIGTILSAIRESGAGCAGIINADCKITGYPGLADNLSGLKEIVIPVSRVDIDADGSNPQMPLGWDAFFFDTTILPKDDLDFSIGDPWWDIWFPLACAMQGAQIEMLAAPLLTHCRHPQNWSWIRYVEAGNRFNSELRKWCRRCDTLCPESIRGAVLDDWNIHWLGREQLDNLNILINRILQERQSRTVSILPPDMADVEAMLRLGWVAMSDAAALARIKLELAAIRNSTSWRITAPLRLTMTAARALAGVLY